jgi:hypothetical protein
MIVRPRADTLLTPPTDAVAGAVSERSATFSTLTGMNGDPTDTMIRRAIGGDPAAIELIIDAADDSDLALVVVMAAVLEGNPGRLSRAKRSAHSSRDRQVVEIATAYLGGNRERVDELARDHLVDHPDSLIVAWIASDAGGSQAGDSWS